jgi:hypothetical protein
VAPSRAYPSRIELGTATDSGPPAQPSDLKLFIRDFAFAGRVSVIRLAVPPARANNLPALGLFWARHGDEGLKSVGSCGELSFDPTVDASVEDIEREGTAGEDLVMEGLEVELCA